MVLSSVDVFRKNFRPSPVRKSDLGPHTLQAHRLESEMCTSKVVCVTSQGGFIYPVITLPRTNVP